MQPNKQIKIFKKKKKPQNFPTCWGQVGQDGPHRAHQETQSSAGQDQRIWSQEYSLQNWSKLNLLWYSGPGGTFSPFAGMIQFSTCSNERRGSESVEQIGLKNPSAV